MFGSSILDVAIGMVFVYLLMSLICTAANEIIESFLKNRATDLERGLRELFNQESGGGLVESFYKHPLIHGLFKGTYARGAAGPIGRMDFLKSTNLPSYIPGRNFTYAIIDLILHPEDDTTARRDEAGQTGAAAGAAAPVTALPVSMETLRAAITQNMGNTQVGRALRTLAEQSGDDLNLMRENIEAWFNSSMDRVSGAYKRRTKWVVLGLGLLFTIVLNVNTITIAKQLSTDITLRSVIVAQAEAVSKNSSLPAADFKANKEELEGLGLPIGWPGGFHVINPWASWRFDRNPGFSWWENFLLPLFGWLLTAGAISLGAPFWFDMLNKIMVVRSTVKPHEKSPEESSEDRQLGRDRDFGSSRRPGLAPPPTTIPPLTPAPTPVPAPVPAPAVAPEPADPTGAAAVETAPEDVDTAPGDFETAAEDVEGAVDNPDAEVDNPDAETADPPDEEPPADRSTG